MKDYATLEGSIKRLFNWSINIGRRGGGPYAGKLSAFLSGATGGGSECT